MEKYFSEFSNLISKKEKDQAITYCINLIEEGKANIPDLYEKILSKFLKEIGESKEVDIYKEHYYTNIIRTIIENCYTAVQNKKAENNGMRVLLLSPEEEYHEIGLRMVNDFLELKGFTVDFIGVNTPTKEIINALGEENYNYVAISISNYYNLSLLDDIVEEIKKVNKEVKIIAGGSAFKNNNDICGKNNVDYFFEKYCDFSKVVS